MPTKEFVGNKAIDHLSECLSFFKTKSIFLVTGRKSYIDSKAQKILTPFLKNYTVTRYSDFTVNPKIEDVLRGVKTFLQHPYDLVIAVGGGTVIDIAKLINIYASNHLNSSDNLLKPEEIKKKGIPLIAVPTTSGSGSEATHFAVVYSGKKKYSIAHPHLLPTVALVDPVFTYNSKASVIAISGIDALAQAIESYWSSHSTEKSKEYASKAIETLLKFLPEALNADSHSARNEISRAAHYSGKAINISKTTAPHALSYPFTSTYNLVHGQAVALTLPEFFLLNSRVTKKTVSDPRGIHYVKKTMQELITMLNCTTPAEAYNKLREFILSLGLHIKLSNCTEVDDLYKEKLVKYISIERLRNNPRHISMSDIIDVLIKIK